MEPPLETHGAIPDLFGLACEGILSQGSILGDAVAPDRILFIQAGRYWHRLVIDNGVVFWRVQADAPSSWSIPEQGFHFPVRSVEAASNLLRQRFQTLVQKREGPVTSVEFGLTGGHRILFSEVQDQIFLRIE